MPEVVEGAPPEPPAPDGARPWGWLLAGLVLGAGASLLFTEAQPVPSPTLPTPTAVTTAEVEPPGFGAAVPGFPDGLVATVRREGQSQELLVWPVAGEAMRRAVPVVSPTPQVAVVFDPSGGRLASLVPGPEGGGGLLYAGVPQSAAVIATTATGFAWHDSAPARLAYTTIEGGELLLWVADGNQSRSRLVTRAVGIEGGVTAYGDWGFAVDNGEMIVLLNAEGEIKALAAGRVLASHGSGWMLVDNEELWLQSSGGGLSGLVRGAIGDESAVASAFSPDGMHLAVLTSSRVLVVDREGNLALDPIFLRPRLPALVRWSSDGRFVFFPGTRGLEVIDVGTGIHREVLEGEILTGAGVLPLTAP